MEHLFARLVAIAIGLGIAYWLLTTYTAQVVIVAAVIGVIWLAIDQIKRHVVRETMRRQHEAEQDSLRSQLVTLTFTSLATFEAMPTQLLSAEGLLGQAEADFKESAFAPFWDSVEKAATSIGRFDDGVRAITLNCQQHLEVARAYEVTAPQFPISSGSVRGMVVANTTTNRMRAIVRMAQCNFQFATIYEQRKTNKLLVAGFQNLAQAIDGFGDRIASSIDGLGNQISEMSSSLKSSLSEVNDQAAERHKQALEMLDNIQRRRSPYPRRLGDGAY